MLINKSDQVGLALAYWSNAINNIKYRSTPIGYTQK